MPRTTPLYGLPALAPTDRARDIADIDWQNAQRIESILANRGQPPLSSDLVALVKRVNAIDSRNTDWTPFALKSGFTSVGAALRIKNGRVELRGSIQNTAGQYPNGYTELGTLPGGANSKFAPTAYLRIPCATFNGFTANFVVNPGTGVIQVGYSSATALSDAFYMGGQSWDLD